MSDIVLDQKQIDAVAISADLSKRIVAISGPAGSGKTTIIENTVNKLNETHEIVVICAPTGKAARRIKEATGLDAVTIHKLLEYPRPGERDEKTGEPMKSGVPRRGRVTPLDAKVIIVDEYAMVNWELHNNLIAALPSGGVIRAFGDVHQLPPIESYKVTDNAGKKMETPFEKLLKRPDSVNLETVYRQAEGSNILLNADKIRRGHTPQVNKDLGDFYIRLSDDPVKALKTLVLEGMENSVDFRSVTNQIITPTKKTWIGTQKLNVMLRNLLNPRPEQTQSLPRHKWDKDGLTLGLGDKIVCTTNTYDMRDYYDRFAEWTETGTPIMHTFITCPATKQMLNGETGRVTAINPDGGIECDFGDRIVEIPAQYDEYWAERDTVITTQPQRELDLAYALTTHKCQGSQFSHVVYLMNRSAQFILSRQNFYTAVTRAKDRVDIITDQTALKVAVMRAKK